MREKCGQCNKSTTNKHALTCSGFTNFFDQSCTKLSLVLFDEMVKVQNSSATQKANKNWYCAACKKINDSKSVIDDDQIQ